MTADLMIATAVGELLMRVIGGRKPCTPYFHDGSQATLWDVIDHYNKGAGPTESIRPLRDSA